MNGEMNPGYEELRKQLYEVANNRSYTTYSKVAPIVNLQMSDPEDRDRMSEILTQIDREECKLGRPLLSAVVIREDINKPGDGFFKCARELGLYYGDDDLKYWLEELRRVHDFDWPKS